MSDLDHDAFPGAGSHTRLSRKRYAALAEIIADIESVRARAGIQGVCPILDFLKGAPSASIADVIEAETYIQHHPVWGAEYCADVIATIHWHKGNDAREVAIQQLDHMVALLRHPEGEVTRRVQRLLLNSGFVFRSREALGLALTWLRAHHAEPDRFFALDAPAAHLANTLAGPTEIAPAPAPAIDRAGIVAAHTLGEGERHAWFQARSQARAA